MLSNTNKRAVLLVKVGAIYFIQRGPGLYKKKIKGLWYVTFVPQQMFFYLIPLGSYEFVKVVMIVGYIAVNSVGKPIEWQCFYAICEYQGFLF